ncbi:MAG: deoxyribodipyrimidine photo-lyase [Chthoniobacterales bacterium]|nr:deoxyribodipyrimidine photo-lyase [Chthoniobacterales bacterium]
MKTVIHWFRRDLRLTDNTALAAAANAGDQVVPVYVVSGWKNVHRWTGAPRQTFLCGSLASLDGNLRSIGSRLVVREGDAVAELVKLARETDAGAVYTNRDPDPHGRATEERLVAALAAEGRTLRAGKDAAVHEQDEVKTGAGGNFRVFTPYSKAWAKLEKPPVGPRLKKLSTPEGIKSAPLPLPAHWGLSDFTGGIESGEKAARARLQKFLAGPIHRYGATRDLMGEDGTSRLSQDLRHGLLSIREVYERSKKAAEGADADGRNCVWKYVAELIWREFYFQILWHYPEVLEHEFNPKYRGMGWDQDEKKYRAWCEGRTGFPIVDAAMRQLNETGYMHNRSRMITAMFLTKDLHLDWRLGEKYFMQTLIDGEIASNNGGWQWSAGTGADAAPYFRIQNPWSQTARYDAEGKYIKQWVTELRDVPAAKFLEAPVDDRPIAAGYPLPMVDHGTERDETLRRFKVVS